MNYRLAFIVPAYLAIYAACACAAFVLRFEFSIPAQQAAILAAALPYIVAMKFAVVLASGEWRRSFRYASLSDVWLTTIAMTAASGILYIANPFLFNPQLPRSVILIDWMLTVLASGLLRCAFRMYSELFRPMLNRQHRKRTLIFGTGGDAMTVYRALQSAHCEFQAVGFLDAGDRRQRSLIGGVRVYSSGMLRKLAARFDASHVLIPSGIPGREVREIIRQCVDTGLTANIIPTVDELVDGRYRLAIRDVTISDLLHREPAQLDLAAIKDYVAGRRVLVTGGAGSIGSELCRQILSFGPRSLVLVDHSEGSMFNIQQELLAGGGREHLHFVVADVGDEDAMLQLMERHRPQLIFHAAAYKHVPLMEDNPVEAIRNNVLGTRTLVEMAERFDVERFVLISTDKAVNPTSIMGATKLVSEKLLQAASARSQTLFITVRFGNVLNSAGSVVPTFRRQIEAGGPITVTHPDMRRYFMTIPEAVQLVLQAGGIGESGDVMILDMGEPVRIVDLAKDMISLSGLKYPEDIDIEFTGVRPGEKLYEELLYESEAAAVKVHDQIYRSPRKGQVPLAGIGEDVERLEAEIASDPSSAVATLWSIARSGADHSQDRSGALRSAA